MDKQRLLTPLIPLRARHPGFLVGYKAFKFGLVLEDGARAVGEDQHEQVGVYTFIQ